MEKDKKSGLDIVVIFLSIIVTLLVGYIIYDKFFSSKDTGKLLEVSKYEEYKNFDDSYGAMKKYSYVSDIGRTYTLSLGMDGSVYVGEYSTRKYITNVSNAIDIVYFDNIIEKVEKNKYYILTNSGDVYVYNLSDIIDAKYEATLVESVKNVDRLIEYYYAPSEDVGSLWGVIAILENGKYVELVETGI